MLNHWPITHKILHSCSLYKAWYWRCQDGLCIQTPPPPPASAHPPVPCSGQEPDTNRPPEQNLGLILAPHPNFGPHFGSQIKTNSTLVGKLAQNNGIIRAGRDIKAHLIPAPCQGQGNLPLSQVAQSPIQLGLEHFSPCGILVSNFSLGYSMNHPVRLGPKWSGLKQMRIWGCLGLMPLWAGLTYWFWPLLPSLI